jgi:hypothetical protein
LGFDFYFPKSKGDREVLDLLTRIRGTHMFIPNVALNAMEHGCNQAIQRDPNASSVVALKLTVNTLDKIDQIG